MTITAIETLRRRALNLPVAQAGAAGFPASCASDDIEGRIILVDEGMPAVP